MMKIVGKISMIFAAIIIIAHTIIPHQHKAQIQSIIHECLFSEDTAESKNLADIFHKLADLIKHVNLGEKHLENFRISSYEYNLTSVAVFVVPEISSFKLKLLLKHEKLKHVYYYNTVYTSAENDLSSGLRGPPYI